MEVLLLGPEGADADAVARTLIHEGHDVHRCSWSAHLVEEARRGPCLGAADHAACPLNAALDVGLVVGDGARSDGIAPIGLGCAIRDRLPIATLAPGGDPIAACMQALRARDEEWTGKLRDLLGREDVSCQGSRVRTAMRVTLHADVSEDDVATTARLATRAYDVVRDQLPSGMRSVDVVVAHKA